MRGEVIFQQRMLGHPRISVSIAVIKMIVVPAEALEMARKCDITNVAEICHPTQIMRCL